MQKYAEDMKTAKLEQQKLWLLAGFDSLGSYQPGGDFWCLWLQRNQPQIWGLISWARKPWSISVCISGKDFLQFRTWSCSNTLLEGRKIGNCQCSCSEQVGGEFLLWEIPNCYFGFKIRTVGVLGVFFFVCFLNICFLQNRDVHMRTISASRVARCSSVPLLLGQAAGYWRVLESWSSPWKGDRLLKPSP